MNATLKRSALVFTWKGRDIRELTREELLEVAAHLGEEIESWRRRWEAIRWCHSGCSEDRQQDGSGPTIGGGCGLF